MNTWWSLGRVRGIGVRVHWSALLGAIFFSGMRFAPGAWLGFLLVILVHELGHALIVRLSGQRVHGIDIHGLGGECRWSGNATRLQRAAIAWGGVWAQLALFAVALPLSWLVVPAFGGFAYDLFYALTWNSLLLAALNLVPFPPLDGAEAWKLPGLLRDAWRRRRVLRADSVHRIHPVIAGGRSFDDRPFERSVPRAEPVSARPKNDLEDFFRKIAKDAKDARRS